jgi:hypothetical protein
MVKSSGREMARIRETQVQTIASNKLENFGTISDGK